MQDLVPRGVPRGWYPGACDANRVGKGTHRAINRYDTYRQRFKHVLRADIYRFFPAIDHVVLKGDLRRRIA